MHLLFWRSATLILFLPPAGDRKKRSREVQSGEGNLRQALGCLEALHLLTMKGGEMGRESLCTVVGSCPFDSPMRGQTIVKDQCAERQRWGRRQDECVLFCFVVIDLITKHY